ncbi:MAG: transposase [Ignavibacteria bacterium]|nr:transposase [Ignavibacteria bacterium]
MGLRGRSLFDKQGNLYFITTTIMNFDKIFALGNAYNNIAIDSIKYLLVEHSAFLTAYVIMPHHIHMMLYVPENESLIAFMRDFKKYTSTQIRKQLEADKNLVQIERLRANAKKYPRQVFKLWEDRYDDFVLYEDYAIQQKFDYIHMNPVRAGLVENPEDWLYSSARNYILNDNSIIEVTPI